MRLTLNSMRSKEQRLKVRESTAEEWEDILKQAESERLEYRLNIITEQPDDEEIEEQAAMELKDEQELTQASKITPKRKKKTPRWMKTSGSLKKEW